MNAAAKLTIQPRSTLAQNSRSYSHNRETPFRWCVAGTYQLIVPLHHCLHMQSGNLSLIIKNKTTLKSLLT